MQMRYHFDISNSVCDTEARSQIPLSYRLLTGFHMYPQKKIQLPTLTNMNCKENYSFYSNPNHQSSYTHSLWKGVMPCRSITYMHGDSHSLWKTKPDCTHQTRLYPPNQIIPTKPDYTYQKPVWYGGVLEV